MQRDGVASRRTRDFPRIDGAQPVVGALDLRTVANHLPENAVLVAQAVADGRVLERGERVDEAGREPAQAAVAESCIGLFLDHRIEIPSLLLQRTLNQRFRGEIHHVVAQRAAEQILQGEVVDALGVRVLPRLTGGNPAVRDQVADEAAGGLEFLARSR